MPTLIDNISIIRDFVLRSSRLRAKETPGLQSHLLSPPFFSSRAQPSPPDFTAGLQTQLLSPISALFLISFLPRPLHHPGLDCTLPRRPPITPAPRGQHCPPARRPELPSRALRAPCSLSPGARSLLRDGNVIRPRPMASSITVIITTVITAEGSTPWGGMDWPLATLRR
jgi:hypothetical protein